MKFKSSKQRKKVMAIIKQYGKLPKTIVPSDYQIGKTHIKEDRQHRALKPGKRVSKKGKVYYEHRRTRSDKHPAQRL